MNSQSENNFSNNQESVEARSRSCSQQIAFAGETAQLFARAQTERRSMAGLSEIATARLQGLLLEGRQDIGRIFDASELSILLHAFEGRCFLFSEITEFASTACDALGFDLDRPDFEEHAVGPLIKKLLGLDTPQRLALADAIEQGWASTGREGEVGLDAFTSLDIDFHSEVDAS